MTSHQRWTQTALTDLRARLADGESLDHVADALGRNAADVRVMMLRLRLRAKTEG